MNSRLAVAPGVVLSATAVLAGCSGAGVEPSPAGAAGTPYLRGPVASITAAAGSAPAAVLVQPAPGAQESCGIRAFVTARTPVQRRSSGGATSGAALGDVRVGDTVEVYVAGPVALSCPAQAEASALVLVGPAGP